MEFETCCKAFDELSLNELYKIMALRQEVFVVEQNCPYLDADGIDQLSLHLFYRTDKGQIVAYARLIPKGISYSDYPSIGRVITSPQHRRKGLGRAIMNAALDWSTTNWIGQTIKISAQCYLEQFYTSLGFEGVGGSYLEDGIPHLAMIRK